MSSHPIEEANAESLFGGLRADEFYEHQGVKHSEEWMMNERGMRIFTQSWEPIRRSNNKGLVLMLHGFTGDSSWTVQLTAVGIAARGYSVHALDHQGHGCSEGLRAHIPDICPVIADCAQFSRLVRQRTAHAGPFFYVGESLGGALALLLNLRYPSLPCHGLILIGAMCGISAKFQPPWPIQQLLRAAAFLAPTLPIVPTKPIAPISFKEPWKLQLVQKNPYRIHLKPRPATALEFLRVVAEIESHLHEITVPFLVVHGELDEVCDPEGVRVLYEKASSSDKTLKMYEGMWHQLVGEPKENLDIVFSDICAWLDARAATSHTQEGQQTCDKANLQN